MNDLNKMIAELNAAQLVFFAALEDFDELLERVLKSVKTTSFPLATQSDDEEENKLENVLFQVREHLNGGEAFLMSLRLLDYLLTHDAGLFDMIPADDYDALDSVLKAFRRYDAASVAMKRWSANSKREAQE